MDLQDLVVSLVGVCLVFFGFAIRYWVGKRRFYRRGPGGLQHYSSYSRALIITTIERFANFLSIPLILLGLFLLTAWWIYVREVSVSNKKEENKNKNEIEFEPSAHFLVPAEDGFVSKKICPIPCNYSQGFMSWLG